MNEPALKETISFTTIEFRGTSLVADPRGCLFWPEENLLIVSDLHLEKGSSFAARKGIFVPPYDTQVTLDTLSQCIDDWQPGTILSLGDSFHDDDASERLPETFRAEINRLMKGRNWIWVLGNHDPSPPKTLGGSCCTSMHIGNLNFIHEPGHEFEPGEIAGHLHPCGKIRRRGKSVRRRCFVGDNNRMILPAFGSFTGGLNVRDEAFNGLFHEAELKAWMLSGENVFAIDGKQLVR